MGFLLLFVSTWLVLSVGFWKKTDAGNPSVSYNIVALTGHKTGTELVNCLFQNLHNSVRIKTRKLFPAVYRNRNELPPGYDVEAQHSRRIMMHLTYHVWQAWYAGTGAFAPYRMIQFTRHPLDRYLSSDRYHRTSTETWLSRTGKFDLSNKALCDRWGIRENTTYQEFINSLDASDSLLFTMHSLAPLYNLEWKDGLLNMSSVSSSTNKRYLVKLEDCRTAWKNTTAQLLSYVLPMEIAARYDAEKMFSSCNFEMASHGAHATVHGMAAKQLQHNVFDFPGKLTCIHYLYFEHHAGGTKAIEGFHYGSSLHIYIAERHLACSQYDKDAEAMRQLKKSIIEKVFPRFYGIHIPIEYRTATGTTTNSSTGNDL